MALFHASLFVPDWIVSIAWLITSTITGTDRVTGEEGRKTQTEKEWIDGDEEKERYCVWMATGLEESSLNAVLRQHTKETGAS